MAVIGNSPATTGTTVSAQSFNGDNSTVAFTLTRSVNSTVDLEVLVDNVQQSPYDGSYSVSGTTLTFSAAPATGTNNIYVIYRGATIATAQVIPDDGSVTNAKMANNAIEATNIASNAVTVDKLNGGSVEGLMTTQFGRRNLIINGAMQVAQRGTSATSIADSSYPALDRWKYFLSNITTDTSQQSFTLGQTDVSGEPEFFVRNTIGSNSGSSNYSIMAQHIEDVRTLAGQTATLSFWAKSSVNGNKIGIEFNQNFGGGSSRVTTVASQAITLSNSWQKFTVTLDITSISGKTIGTTSSSYLELYFWFSGGSNWNARSSSIGNQSGDFDIAQVQLEVGSVATPFEHRSYGEELALCQRYAFVIYNPEDTISAYVGTMSANNRLSACIDFPIPMRTPPTTFSVNAANNWGIVTPGYLNAACSTVTLATATRYNAIVLGVSTTNTFRTGDAGNLYSTSSNANMIFEAEL
jgi:hypothetical protein